MVVGFPVNGGGGAVMRGEMLKEWAYHIYAGFSIVVGQQVYGLRNIMDGASGKKKTGLGHRLRPAIL
jgi:hypothetical protein